MKKTRKWLAMLLAVCLVVYGLPLSAAAAEASGTCGDNVTWKLEGNTLTISGYGPMEDYHNYNHPWGDYRRQIQTVVIEQGITSIGKYAFEDCSSLTSITIPDSVTNIERSAFNYCTNLPKISVDPHNPSYANDTRGALFTKDMKTLVSYPSGNQASQYTIPNSVTNIGEFAFFHCSSLTNIDIPDGVTSIGDYAFSGCYDLSNITIPASVTMINYAPFVNCSQLKKITVDSNNPAYANDIYGVLFTKNMKTLVEYPVGCTAAQYAIPDSVTRICCGAFANSCLTSITIPEGVTSIEMWAFRDSSLTSIIIPTSVTSIESWAFSDCDALKDVYYSGTEDQWTNIAISTETTTFGPGTEHETVHNNAPLLNATIHFNSTGPDPTPEMTTENLQTVPDGVVDVPYQAIIETTLGENLTKSHELVIETGELPQGLVLEADGELHGIPSQAGEYEFTVALKGLNSQDMVDKRSYKVIVKESTPKNVAAVNTSSQGYRLLDPLPEVIDFDKVEAGAEFTFRSEGPFDQLAAVYIDGDELTPGVDYSASEGSCTIVLSEMGYGGRTSGRHVISATFKQPSTQGNFTIKKTAQAVSFVNPKPRPIPKYRISLNIDRNGGGTVLVSNQTAEAGKAITVTARPNYGWEINQVTAGSAKVTKNGDKYTFTMPNSTVTVKASFKRIGAAEGTGMPFFDVRTTDWFYTPVKAAYDAGLMIGTDSNAFSPKHPALRAMIATILYRHAGSPMVDDGCPFTDVKAGSYYEKAVIWAKKNWVIDGVSTTKFNPSGQITREQLVTMLYRYAGNPEENSDLSVFTDIDELSGYATDAMSWAVENGIVTGKGNNLLDPKGNATRAEIAAVLQRFMEL